MKSGTIIEYIDQQKLICAAVADVKGKRLRLITENDKEVSLSASRISLTSDNALPESASRSTMVETLKATVARRESLKQEIDLKELWELLNEEGEWIDLKTMAEYCFEEAVTSDHKSAIIRAFFQNRTWFKFDHDRFLPYTPEQVEQMLAKKREEERRNKVISEGAAWLKGLLGDGKPKSCEHSKEIITCLKGWYIDERESRHFEMAKAVLSAANINSQETVFKILVKLEVFDENENIDLIRMEVPRNFSEDVLEEARKLAESAPSSFEGRRDLTHLSTITIDGRYTTDYDDAVTIERLDDRQTLLGIHIVDVAESVKRGSLIDRRALSRGSSIYMPDHKIPMLPSDLSDNLCSLVEGAVRPCISVMITLNRFHAVQDFEVVPTVVTVRRQLTYTGANTLANEGDEDLSTLIKIGQAFRQKRLDAGAVHLSLPEVNVHLDEEGTPIISTVDRESPSRMMVAELMIMANWLMASFLARHGLPTFFRLQPDPKERLFKGEEPSLYLNCMQRKQLSRAYISQKAGHHSGLGLDAYTTASSPIRRYYDLVSQRQIRSVLGLEEPYTEDDVAEASQHLDIPMGSIGRIQSNRKRYWILKYLENKIGERVEGLVLDKRRHSFQVLLLDYMMEVMLPASGLNLKSGDMVQTVIQHADARKDNLAVFVG